MTTSLYRSLSDRYAVFALVAKTATEAPKPHASRFTKRNVKSLPRALPGNSRVERMKGEIFKPKNSTFHAFNSCLEKQQLCCLQSKQHSYIKVAEFGRQFEQTELRRRTAVLSPVFARSAKTCDVSLKTATK